MKRKVILITGASRGIGAATAKFYFDWHIDPQKFLNVTEYANNPDLIFKLPLDLFYSRLMLLQNTYIYIT